MMIGIPRGNENRVLLDEDTVHFHCEETSTSLGDLRERILLASHVPIWTPTRKLLASPIPLGALFYAILEENPE